MGHHLCVVLLNAHGNRHTFGVQILDKWFMASDSCVLPHDWARTLKWGTRCPTVPGAIFCCGGNCYPSFIIFFVEYIHLHKMDSVSKEFHKVPWQRCGNSRDDASDSKTRLHRTPSRSLILLVLNGTAKKKGLRTSATLSPNIGWFVPSILSLRIINQPPSCCLSKPHKLDLARLAGWHQAGGSRIRFSVPQPVICEWDHVWFA